MKIKLASVDLLSIMSTVLFLIAPFASWATLYSFGFVIEASLWDLATYHTSFQIGDGLARVALFAGLIYLAAALVSLRWSKLAVGLSTVGLLAFIAESYSIYGTYVGGIPVTILPGVGFLVILGGIMSGIASLRTQKISLSMLASNAGTRAGFFLTRLGILASSLSLGLDLWNHWSEGHLSATLGTTSVEMILHLTFLLGIPLVLLVYVLGGERIFWGRTGLGLTMLSVAGLVLDGFYHAATGSAVAIVGTGTVEILLHGLTYYGIVSVLLARMFQGEKERSMEHASCREDEIVIST